jgi:hypothetical protein
MKNLPEAWVRSVAIRMLMNRITGFLDFFHRPVFYRIENTTFRKLDLFPSSGEGEGEEAHSPGPN